MRGESDGQNCYTYILRCSDGTLYTGWTTDPVRRTAVHNAGKGAKYTRSRLPVELVYAERFSTKEEAMSREAAIKRLTRAKKLELIASSAATGTETKTEIRTKQRQKRDK